METVRSLVRTAPGAPPGRGALEDAVARVDAQRCTAALKKSGVADARYANCGRAPLLSTEQKQSVVAFVKRWRSKRFCTANYIIRELKLACKKKTVHGVLSEAGYHWRAAPKGASSRQPSSRRGSSTHSIICDPFDKSFADGTQFVTICDSFVTMKSDHLPSGSTTLLIVVTRFRPVTNCKHGKPTTRFCPLL